MNIRHRDETYSGWGCKGYPTREEAESIRAKVEESTRKMPGLLKVEVSVAIDSNTGRYVVFDHSAYDEDARIMLTRQPAGARLIPA